MVASAFSGVIVASAENTDTPNETTPGIILKYDEANSTSQKAVIIAEAVGVATIDAWQVNLVPEDSNVVIASGDFEAEDSPFSVNANLHNGTYYVIATGDTPQVVADNAVLATITVNFENSLEKDTTLKLDIGSALEAKDAEGNNVRLYLDGLETDSLIQTSVTASANPSVTPATTEPVATATATATATAEPTKPPYETTRPTARPTATAESTEEPVQTAAPVTQGIKLEYVEEKSTSDTIVIVAKAVGVATIDAWQVNLVPEDSNVVIAAGEFEAEGSPFTVNANLHNGTYYVIATGDTPQVVENSDVLATITLKVASALTANTKIKLDIGSALEAKDAEGNNVRLYLDGLETDSLGNTFATALAKPNASTESPTATATPEPFTGGEIALGDLISADTPAEDETLGKLVSVVVTVTTSDDKEAVYGEDYVAKYKDEELTEDEYFNLINGYGDAIKDALKEIVFVVDDGVTVNAAPAYQTAEQETSGEITVVPGLGGEDTYTKPSPTATATAKPTPTATATNRPNNGNGSGNNNNGNNNNNNGSGQIARPGTTVNTGTGVTSVNFTDLDSVAWARDAINALARSGLINGRSETIFDPNASVTRAEFTKMVCSAFGVASTPNAAQKFTDVAPSDWYYGWVQAAASYGIVTGVSDTAFDPNATIKRQDMATIMYRAIQSFNMTSSLPAGTPKTFADYDQIDDYAKASVTALSSASVINGTSATTFEPYATATRAQAACIIYQYYKAIGAM